MRVFKTKEFARFARREALRDVTLLEAASRAERGLIDADLGGGLIKQRVARPRQGRRRRRTLMAFRSGDRTVFVYGFAKNERDNIGLAELEFWRKVAAAFLTMDDPRLRTLLAGQEIMEVVGDG